MKWKEQFDFLKYCFHRRNDKRFIADVMDIQKDVALVKVESFGVEPSRRILYHIFPEASHSGFFADHNRTLSLLYFADQFGFTPVVEYGKEYCYREEHPVNGTENPFEYYFKQPSSISLEEMKTYRGVIKSRKMNAGLAGRLNKESGNYGMTKEYIEAMAGISAKYISLNDMTHKKIYGDIEQLLEKKKAIGVHVRGTDFKNNYVGHPVSITAREYLDETKRVFEQGSYEKVFLATDDTEAIRLFGQAFEEKLCYYQEVTRSDGDETVMKSESSRENHRYLLGLEVLRDMYTLASCDALIAGLSQVSFCARIQKKSRGTDYEKICILNYGTNRYGKNCPK